MSTKPGTIIIGGGLAGLAAARELSRNDRPFILLEARDRLGGRVFSERSQHTSLPIELGPEWIEGTGEVSKILKEEKIELRKANGGYMQRTSAGWKKIDRIFDEATRLARSLDRERSSDRSLSEALSAQHEADPRQLEMLLYYVKSFHAADPDRLSMQWLREVEAEHSADAAQMRSTRPLGELCSILSRDLDPTAILLSTVVRSVQWSKGSVRVEAKSSGEGMSFTSRDAIITLPLPLLKSGEGKGGVQFDPPLHEKSAALSRLAMGNVIKMMLVFDRPFWMEMEGAEEALFLMAFDRDIPTFWTTSPEREPVLTAWVAGSLVDRIDDRDPQHILELALSSLAAITGKGKEELATRLRSWHHHDWIDDPFSRGAYSYVMPGGVQAHADLARPIDGTLFFAGEATAGKGANATMEGAIQSGVRAAKEVMGK